MTTTARLTDALAWALDQLPDGPPRSADSGWCPADVATWHQRRREARAALYEAQASMSEPVEKPTRKRAKKR